MLVEENRFGIAAEGRSVECRGGSCEGRGGFARRNEEESAVRNEETRREELAVPEPNNNNIWIMPDSSSEQ